MSVPVGTVVEYDKWRCTVERAEGLERECRDEGRRARFFGVFTIFGKLDNRRYGGAIASMSCDALTSLMPVAEQALDSAAIDRIKKFWPLRIGKRTRFNLRHGPRDSQIIDIDLRVSHRERIFVGGRTRQVLVVKGRSGYVDCPNNLRGNYLSDVGSAVYVDQTWWYEPKTGVVVKYEARWPDQFGRAEYYQLVSVSFPNPPRALARSDWEAHTPSGTAKDESVPKAASASPDTPRDKPSASDRSEPTGSDRKSPERPPEVARATPETPPPPRDDRARLRPRSSATGFVVSRAGHVLTNDHVLRRCSEVRVVGLGAGAVKASIVARDERNDLAVLKIDRPPTHVAKFRNGRPIRLGEEIVVYGFPLRGLLAAGGNLTIGIVSARSGIRGDTRHLQITAPLQPGNSGGPLLDRSGNVVGVVMSKLDAIRVAKITGDIPQNINFAIKTPMVQAFLDVHDVPYETRAWQKKLEIVDVSDQAATFTVVVECWAERSQ